MDIVNKIGFGGSCHWCTEAIYQMVKGVNSVDQGWVSAKEAVDYHEAVIVHFDPTKVTIKDLIEIHLHTHSSTADHSFRNRYRSAIYTYSKEQAEMAVRILDELQSDFADQLVTKVYRFGDFRTSPATFQNYYRQNPDKPFCKSYIDPKLKLLKKRFGQISRDE